MNRKVKSAAINPFAHGENTAVETIKMPHKMSMIVLLFLVPFLLTACNQGAEGESSASLSSSSAADYCRQSGGEVETRYPFYGTNQASPRQLSGSLEVCKFTAGYSHIIISLDTLYTDQPTLAALAYRAQTPIEGGGTPSANPSSLYCTQLGGTDSFGGVSAAGGGWALADGADAIALCVFPDLSVIDSWGITYHAEGTILGPT